MRKASPKVIVNELVGRPSSEPVVGRSPEMATDTGDDEGSVQRPLCW